MANGAPVVTSGDERIDLDRGVSGAVDLFLGDFQDRSSLFPIVADGFVELFPIPKRRALEKLPRGLGGADMLADEDEEEAIARACCANDASGLTN